MRFGRRREVVERQPIYHVWEDPPSVSSARSGRPDEWGPRLAPLQERPGQWARVHSPADDGLLPPHGVSFKKRFPEYEIVTRSVEGSDRRACYARFIGDAARPDVEFGSLPLHGQLAPNWNVQYGSPSLTSDGGAS